MSISETHVLVGAHVDDGAGGPDQGSVSVFRRAGIEWMLEHELGADDGQAADYFGVSVALQGNRAVVGAQGDDDRGPDAGAAYLFEREPGSGRWSQIAKFHGSDTNAGDRFGRSCAWVGSRLFVGANGADTPVGLNRGKVYVFDWSGAAFVETAQLHAPDGLVDDQFGVALDSSGDHVAISAFVADVQVGVDAGAVYVFHGNGSSWLLENKLTAALGDTEDRFGSGLSIDGDLLVVGASHDEQAGNLSGTAHVFSHDEATHTWSHATRLRPSDTNDWDSFGWAVKLEGSLLFVGAPFRDTEVSIGAGVVHVFRAQAGPVGRNWVEAARLQAPDATHNQKFGMSLAYRDGLLVVGAPGHDSPGVVDTGRAYAFGVLGSDCNLNVSCDLCDVQAGAPDENGNGVPDGCER
jgi:hypothetical protein